MKFSILLTSNTGTMLGFGCLPTCQSTFHWLFLLWNSDSSPLYVSLKSWFKPWSPMPLPFCMSKSISAIFLPSLKQMKGCIDIGRVCILTHDTDSLLYGVMSIWVSVTLLRSWVTSQDGSVPASSVWIVQPLPAQCFSHLWPVLCVKGSLLIFKRH